MKLIHLSDVPKTAAHDSLSRQRFIAPGYLKSKIQTVNYVELAKGESYTPHSHPDCEECFFIIDGKAEAEIAGKRFILRKADFLVVEAGEQHVFANNSNKTFRYFQFRVLI
jgi:mannose-6-phosphate isomerase-like protein (cupin superfamily)